jgi:hypothetical protein
MGCSRASAKVSGIVSDRMRCWFLLGRPGGDLLSRVLGRSTIGAEGFHGRVRDGIGCIAPRNDHQVIEEERCSGLRPSGCWIAIARDWDPVMHE